MCGGSGSKSVGYGWPSAIVWRPRPRQEARSTWRGSLVALHGTDPASIYLAASARMRVPEIGAVERALYDERVLVRVLGMRRTMFVLPLDEAAIVQASCARAIAVNERRKLSQLLEQGGIVGDAESWLRKVEQATLRVLAARGEATASELAEDVPLLREQLVVGVGTKWEGRQAVSTRLLFLLAAEGKIIRGRPRGSWTSSQYRWAPIDSWLPDGLEEWPAEAARAELHRKWLAAFGPGTAADLKWWTGWTVAEVKRALTEIGPAEVELDGETGLVLPDDLEPVPVTEPWVALLLPALDPTVTGWPAREWFLGSHGPALFDRSGNAGPTVWWNGRIVGGWAQRKNGEIAFRLLEDAGADAVSTIRTAAERLGAWLGEMRVTPRFRTPLERELAS